MHMQLWISVIQSYLIDKVRILQFNDSFDYFKKRILQVIMIVIKSMYK